LNLPLQLTLPGLDTDLAAIFRNAHLELKPRTAVPEIHAEFFPFAGLNHTARFQEDRLLIRVSDIFVDAPPDILRSIALILLAKLYRKKVSNDDNRTYRAFILRGDIQEQARVARATRGRSPRNSGAQGRHADLDTCFDRLNTEYFEGKLNRPRLSWSVKRSRRILGRYDSTHHTIVISRLFDSRTVPAYVLEYVMFHEMLHVKHRSRVHDTRMIVHSREFKLEEKTFTHYRQAKLWLKDYLG
jgi:predicted metal-dependent hydrolase